MIPAIGMTRKGGVLTHNATGSAPLQASSTSSNQRENETLVSSLLEIPIPFSRIDKPDLAGSASTTYATLTQPHAPLPSLDFKNPISKRAPSTNIMRTRVTIHPFLAYTPPQFPGSYWSEPVPKIDASNHQCAAATDPGLGSLVIILYTGGAIKVQPSPGATDSNIVTVADVLNAIDTELYAKIEKAFNVVRPPNVDENGVEICPCLGVFTGLECLRNRHGMAGLVQSKMGYNVWDLRFQFP